MENKRYQLDKKVARKFIKALRNPQYTQIRGAYKNDKPNCFCGIGLFAHVNNIFIEEPEMIVGLGQHIDPFLEGKIVDMNDDQEMTFPEIADWIEANVEFI